MYLKLLLLLIFYTFSLTAQWELISTPPLNDALYKAYRFSDDEWLISTRSEYFLKTEDNFKTFRKIHSGADGWAEAMIFFNDTGYVLKKEPGDPDYYRLIKTTDKGESWYPIRNDRLTSISFINKDTGWVSSADGIFFTQNGGLTWDTVFNESVEQVWFMDVWKAFSIINGNLFVSVDGGTFWQRVNLPADEFIQIYYQDNQRGMIIAEQNYDAKIFLTTDGGATYISSEPPLYISPPHAVSLKDSTIFLVGIFGATVRSDDFGATWQTTTFPVVNDYYFDNNLCIAFGYSGLIIKTVDGGKSWGYLGNKPGGNKVMFVDSLNGFTSPWFVTTDGGENWFYKDLLVPNISFQDYHFFTPLKGLAVFGNILFGTNNGGITWDTVFYSDNGVKQLYFLDSNNGWMLVYHDLVSGIRRTTDGGNTWSDFIPVSLDEFFTRKILFTTPETGFIYNDDESYGIEGYKTTDGGLTWNDNGFARVHYMCFVDTSLGFGSGRTEQLGRILIKTTDAGNSFTLISDSFLGGNLFFINDKVGWQVGYEDGWAAFQITLDGGLTWQTEYVLPLLTSTIGWSLHNGTIFAGAEGLLYRRPSLSVDVRENESPAEYSLAQNYPNPFNPVTLISFSLPVPEFVTIKVYDILGREVSVMVNQQYSAGIHKAEFNAEHFSSGIYLYKITAGNYSSVKKMMVLK